MLVLVVPEILAQSTGVAINDMLRHSRIERMSELIRLLHWIIVHIRVGNLGTLGPWDGQIIACSRLRLHNMCQVHRRTEGLTCY